MNADGSRVFPSTLADLEAAAEAVASTEAWDYIAHGAGDEATMRANADAWGRWMLRPHVLRDMSDVNVGTTVLGTAVSAPLLIAPSAMHRFVHDEGAPDTARAAARAGTAYWLSHADTTSLEDVAAAASGTPPGSQMYMPRDRGRTRPIAERSRDAG